MATYVYYTGIKSKKNGKHTITQFLNIMNKHFNIECSEMLSELEYKPCVKYNSMTSKNIEYNMKPNKPLLESNRSEKHEIKYQQLFNKCNNYKKTAKKRQCGLDKYVNFSGAEIYKLS